MAVIVVAVALIGVATLIVSQRQAARQAERQAAEAQNRRAKAERDGALERARLQARPSEEPAAPPITFERLTTLETVSTPPLAASAQSRVAPAASPSNNPRPKTPANPAPGNPKRELQDPLAREALALVGFDSEAEQYWAWAINDPDLPAHEREDLIEDLNEQGFPDPKNITVEDLPLILNRLALIEEYAPAAMDEVNEAAFLEAYKDLVNMLARLAGNF